MEVTPPSFYLIYLNIHICTT